MFALFGDFLFYDLFKLPLAGWTTRISWEAWDVVSNLDHFCNDFGLNSSLMEQLKNMLTDTYALVKIKNMANIGEIQKIIKSEINKYLKRIKNI